MELVIKDIKSQADIKLFTELAKRLGLKTTKLTSEEKEEIGLGVAINKARSTGYVSEDVIMQALNDIKKS